MAKTAVLNARIDPEVKSQAERILSELGIPASSAITIFYRQIILHGGLPFDVTLPPNDVSAMGPAQLNEALEVGYADIQAGRVRDSDKVFSDVLGRGAE